MKGAERCTYKRNQILDTYVLRFSTGDAFLFPCGKTASFLHFTIPFNRLNALGVSSLFRKTFTRGS